MCLWLWVEVSLRSILRQHWEHPARLLFLLALPRERFAASGILVVLLRRLIQTYSFTRSEHWRIKRINWRLLSWKTSCRCSWIIAVPIWPYHFKFLYDFQGFCNIEWKRFEIFIDKNFSLLSDLILSNQIEIDERLVEKCGYVLNLLENLGVITNFNELDKLLKDLLHWLVDSWWSCRQQVFKVGL